jgi:hypothetical protein
METKIVLKALCILSRVQLSNCQFQISIYLCRYTSFSFKEEGRGGKCFFTDCGFPPLFLPVLYLSNFLKL